MSLRSLSLLACLALAAPVRASEHLLVAGVDGSVYRGDPRTGGFEYFACACLGPVNALAADRTDLFAADEFGQLLVVDVNTGVAKGLVATGLGEISALAATRAGLFAGTPGGLVARVDPTTGELLAQRPAPAGVRALASLGGDLFVAASDGAIYRAPLAGGDFTYFSCFCFSNLQSLVASGGDLFAADASGVVVRIEGASGALLAAQWTAPMTAMAMSGGDFLVHGGGGVIGRFDGETGQALGKLESPFDVRAMLVLREATPVTRPASAKGAQRP